MLRAACLVLGIAAIAACSESANPIAPSGELSVVSKLVRYFPPEPGRSWTYARLESGGAVDLRSRFIEEVVRADSNTIYYRGASRPGGDPYALRATADSIAAVLADGSIGAAVLKTPLAVGTTWTADCVRHTITAVDAVVETPAGVFDSVLVINAHDSWDCIIIGMTTYSSISYRAAGVGLIRSELRADGFIGQPIMAGFVLVEWSQPD